MLAHHRAEAGEAEAAAALYLRAGKRSAARSAFREARAHLARGLALLPNVPEERAARRLEAGLRISLGAVAISDEGLGSAESGRAFGRAVELCRGLGEDALLAVALVGLWSYRLQGGHLSEALWHAEEAVEVARGEAGGEHWSLSLAAFGSNLHLIGRSDPAQSALEEATTCAGSYDPGIGAVSGGSLAQPYLARVLACLGALERSAAHAAEAIERARRAGHLPSLAHALVVGCTQAQLQHLDFASG